tara:strand:- start:1473 stop:2417 length:945 start_codon:yes stop_codon:yes gene_type:complete
MYGYAQLKIVDRQLSRSNGPDRQSGVALIQILLISMVLSLLALSFTKTARDQVLMASQFDGRVNAQLAAYSAKSKVVFLMLSDRLQVEAAEDADIRKINDFKNQLNSFGDSLSLGDGLTLTVQDLNGLLPQRHPDNYFWYKFFESFSWSETKIQETIGVWSDFQDPNIDSWILGIEEPETLPTGQSYLNGFAQNARPIFWIFKDDGEVRNSILKVSDINAPHDMNILNMPRFLLKTLFDPAISQSIIENRGLINSEVKALIPEVSSNEFIYVHESGRLKVTISVDIGGARWLETNTLYLTHLEDTPFKVLAIGE